MAKNIMCGNCGQDTATLTFLDAHTAEIVCELCGFETLIDAEDAV